MKIKTLLIFIVLNVFTLLAVSILYEYISIQDKLNQLDRTVNLALERAVYNSTASEELFTEKHAQMGNTVTYSYGGSNTVTSASDSKTNGLSVWDGTRFVRANAYGLTIERVGFPISKGDNGTSWDYNVATHTSNADAFVETKVNGYDAVEVYTWLFGLPKGIYTKGSATTMAANGAMAWADTSRQATKTVMVNTTKSAVVAGNNIINANSSLYDGGIRKDFAEYYSKIGSQIYTANFVKVKDDDSYHLDYMVYPVLTDMGLQIKASDGYNYNSGASHTHTMSDGTTVTAQVMTDNWGQVIKIGKRRTDVAGSARSNYFLSPYSLGVTYIPKDVVKETFIANLDTMCRLNKLASGTTIDMTDTDVVSTLNSATGCIKDGNGNSTNIYPAGGNVSQQHTVGTHENIINDGMIEYDLNSITMKVEYFVVDLWDTNNYKILNTAVGEVGKSYSEVSGLVNKLTRNVENYRDNNTGYNFLNTSSAKTYKVGSRTANLAAGYERNQGRALIARVSVRMKVHIPYTNALIQWGVYKHTHHSSVEHYDIKMYNAGATNVSNFMDGIVGTEDGLWYQTSTYYAVTR